MTGEKILVVDDDRTTASVMRLYLENFGFGVLDIATSGDEAIEKAKSLKPDLVLMDVRLEKGLDGIDAADVIISRMDIPVIYVTAYTDDDTLDRAQMTNHSGFINKPLRETDLRTTIKFALERPKNLQTRGKLDNESLVEMLKKSYNLTKAEARFLAKLVENPDMESAAESLGVSMSTVKTHLKRVFRKTKTNRQSALLHKVVTGPVAKLLKNNNH
ncbi:MAG: response regulator [Desulfobacterales bacterium]